LAGRSDVKLTVLPLNGGHAVYLDAAGRNNDWLVDCGDENAADLTLKPFLRAQGVNRIPRLMLTHGDVRSCGGAALLDEQFGISEVCTGPARFRSQAWLNAVARFDKAPGRRRIVQRGDTAGCWQILHPDGNDNPPKADDNALVLRGDFNGTRFLLLSDLGRQGQNALLSRANDLRADVVIAGLTSDGEPLCEALLDAVQPRIIILADSEFPATRRATGELKDRLARRGIPVLYTRQTGAVTLTARKNGLEVRTMTGMKQSILPLKPFSIPGRALLPQRPI
jgi:competence protein ComEC